MWMYNKLTLYMEEHELKLKKKNSLTCQLGTWLGGGLVM